MRWINGVEEMGETCKPLWRAESFSGMPTLFCKGFWSVS